jgi:hypothetical protein
MNRLGGRQSIFLGLGVVLFCCHVPAKAYELGDLNCDDQVDVDDVGPFILALIDPDGYAAAYPDCDITLADMNAMRAQEPRQQDSKKQRKKVESDDRSSWAVQNERQAIAKAREFLGVSAKDAPNVSAKLVTLADHEDKTPFLHDQLIDRPIWQIVITKWRLRLKSAAPEEKDLYERTFDIFVDPRNGHLLKILSCWPKGVPPIAPRPPADSATEQIKRSGLEKYYRFPDAKPAINFLEALDIVHKEGFGTPLNSKQILAHYVIQSKMECKPRPVWAITLHGFPPFRARGGPGVPEDARNHMRNIVHAKTGEWLGAGTSPQPIAPRPQNTEATDR